MTLLLIILLCTITLHINCAESVRALVQQSYQKKDIRTLVPGMLDADNLSKEQAALCHKHEENSKWPLLKKEEYVTNFWKTVEDECTQEEKDHLLIVAIKTNDNSGEYPVQRFNIAAAALYARVSAVQQQLTREYKYKDPLIAYQLLSLAAFRDDRSLAELLIARGASFKEKIDRFDRENVLYLAESVPFAELPIMHGAFMSEGNRPKDLLHRALRLAPHALITFYRNNGYSASEKDEFGLTPLARLILLPRSDAVAGITALFDGLSQKECAHMSDSHIQRAEIAIREHTFNSIIEGKKVLAFLYNQAGRTCSECAHVPSLQEITVTPCAHVFCTPCLQECYRCPRCQQALSQLDNQS